MLNPDQFRKHEQFILQYYCRVVFCIGNIRVYCRIRPFLPGQAGKQSVIEYIGENGELVVLNASKQGKEGRRSFKFNKVYGPTATQGLTLFHGHMILLVRLQSFFLIIISYGSYGMCR